MLRNSFRKLKSKLNLLAFYHFFALIKVWRHKILQTVQGLLNSRKMRPFKQIFEFKSFDIFFTNEKFLKIIRH